MRYGCWSTKRQYHSTPMRRSSICAYGSITKDESTMMEIFVRAPAAHQPAVSQAPEPDAVSGYAYPGQNMIVVLFRLGNQQYGLPLAVVHEIVRLPALIMLAGAPPAHWQLLKLRELPLPGAARRVVGGPAPRYALNSESAVACRRPPGLRALAALL